MRHWMFAVFTLAGVCLPVSSDFALPLANLNLVEEGAGKVALGLSAAPEREQSVAPGKFGAAAPGEAAEGGDNPSNDAPGSTFSREELCALVASAAEDNALPVGFFMRLIWQESGFRLGVVSRAGAQGIAQFMPAVATSMGVRDAFDPREALPASARRLRGLREKFGNLGLAAAAYNAGPGRVLKWLGRKSRLPQETLHYVQTITGRPAEQWKMASAHETELPVPSRVPCVQVAGADAARTAEAAPVQAKTIAFTKIAEAAKALEARTKRAFALAVGPVARRLKIASVAPRKLEAKGVTLARRESGTHRVRKGNGIRVAETRPSKRGEKRRAT